MADLTAQLDVKSIDRALAACQRAAQGADRALMAKIGLALVTGARLPLDDIRDLPKHLAAPDAVYLHKGDLIYLFAVRGQAPGFVGKIVVHLMRASDRQRSVPDNPIATAEIVRATDVTRDKTYRYLGK
jgi:hypothetical protein